MVQEKEFGVGVYSGSRCHTGQEGKEDCAVQSTLYRAARWINKAKMTVVSSKSGVGVMWKSQIESKLNVSVIQTDLEVNHLALDCFS